MKQWILPALLAFFSNATVQAADDAAVFTGPIAVKAMSTPPGSILQNLADVRSDRDSNVSHLRLVMDSAGKVIGVSFLTDPTSPNTEGEDYYFPTDEIASAQGVVLISSGTHKAVLLRGTIGATQGKMVVSYLANGLSNQYQSCNVNLELADRDWQLINAYTGALVQDVLVKTWNFGIRTIQNICPE